MDTLAEAYVAADVFARELSAPGQTSRLASATGAELEASGYHAQVQPSAETVGIWVAMAGR